MANADGSIIIDTRIDDSGFSKGLNKMKSTVTAGMAIIAAAIGAASVAVISLGADFEQANAKASTLFGDAQVDMAQYQGKMLELSSRTGLAATELGNTMYDALSAGIPATDDMSESLGFLERNTKLAKAGFTDINTATTATAKVLNAYKMDVSETDRVHKVLMQTQNKGITTVNELGSVLSQVTPTASAMGVSFEQVGAALAGMTAQGTPTAQATTQLNQLIAELGKNGTQANTAMTKMYEDMGYGKKSFKELMDEGVTLVDIIVDMEGYAQDNNKSLIDMFGSLEAGKAALSMAGDNAVTFTDNLKAMNTEVDVVGDAYDKVTDTFQEKSKKVVNSLKNVGIAAYSKFEKPLKKSMDVAQGSVDELSRRMSNGKLGKSVDKIAEGFGKLIEVSAKLAEKAIPMIVDSFAFLIDNGEAVTMAVSGIIGSMGAMKALNFSKTTLTPMVDAFSKAKKAAADFAYAQQASIAFGIKLDDTLSLGQIAVGVLTGKISLATAAHAAWNAVKSLDPTMMIVMAVGALTAGITALCFAMNDEKSELAQMADAAEEATEEHLKLREEAEKTAKSAAAEMDYYAKLKKELDGLVDADGRVKAGYEARAKFITNELAEATGIEIEMVGDTVEGYQELSKELDKAIEKRRAKSILDAHEEEYNNALDKQQDALVELSKAEQKLQDIQKGKQDYIDNAMKLSENSAQSETERLANAERAWGSYVKSQENDVDKLRIAYDEYSGTVRSYQQATSDYLSGNYNDINKTIAGTNAKYIEGLEEQKIALESSISEQLAAIKSLNRNKDKMNEEQYTKEKESLDKTLLENQNMLFALTNTTWASTDEYAEAMAYLSEQGVNAFDENGDLTPAARAKIDSLHLKTLELIPEYSDVLLQMAESGEALFNENGSLTPAAEKKLVDTFTKMAELSPEYSQKLIDMAENGEVVFDSHGNLTGAAQKRLITVFAKMNELSPEYSQVLVQMVEDGEMVFDANGNLTGAAQSKILDAAVAAGDKSVVFTNTIKKIAEDGVNQIRSADSYTASVNFMEGGTQGIIAGADRFLGAVGSIARGATEVLTTSWDEASPSKLTRKIARYFVDGLTLGAEDKKDEFLGTVEDIGDEASGVIQKISTMVSGQTLFDKFRGVDLQPLKNAIDNEQLTLSAKIMSSGSSMQNASLASQEVVYNTNVTVYSPEPMKQSELTQKFEATMKRVNWKL